MKIHTDGSCHPNPGGPGGWGYVRSDGREAFGGVESSTNNRMELTAILKALESCEPGQAVSIYSDSQYCINGLTVWNSAWTKSGWKRKGAPIPNRDLWIELSAAKGRVMASFFWVRGHNGDPGNERADKLAEMGRLEILNTVPQE